MSAPTSGGQVERRAADARPADARSADQPAGVNLDAKPSGLRNPRAAVRGVGVAALGCEALVLLLAIQPMRVLGAHLTGMAIGCVVALAVACVALAGVMRRDWAWYAAFAVQVALLACGVFHLALAALGVLFLMVWCYVFNVRRTVLGRAG